MASHGATSDTLTQVMPQLFLHKLPEESIIEILETLCNQKTRPSADDMSNSEPLTWLALSNYPHSHRVLQTLLRCGYSADWERAVIINPVIGEEKTNALLWAVTGERRGKVTIDVLRTLLEAKVDVNYSTRRTLVTPLMIAASNGQTPLLDLLLEYNPDIDATDHLQRSAQSYASEHGYHDIVRRLSERRCRANDGSLHEAARQLHYDIVRHLINQGHDVDDPCTLHEGRSALQEVLLKGQILTSDRRPALEKTLKVLMDAGSDPTLESRLNGDKNALYCALDNSNPYPILEAFFASGQWKYLDEKYNWYTDSRGTCHSATMYVERGPWKGSPQDRARLIDLLRMKRCKDRYFVWHGEQPPDCLNPPAELAEKQRQRKEILDNEDFQLSLAQRAHSQQMELSKASHTLQLQQERQRKDAEMQLADLQHQQRKRHQSDADAQRLNTLQIENDMAYTHQKRLGDARMAESDHAARKELEMLNRKKEIEGWRMDRADQSDRNRHEMVLKQIDAQKRLISSGHGSPTSPLAIMGRTDSVYSSRSYMPD